MRLSTTTKWIGGAVLFSLGWIVLGACDCDETKEQNFPGFWVSCIDKKPTLMTYNDNNATVVTSDTAGNFSPSDYDCSHDANSPQYKGSEASAPFQTSSVSGPGGFAVARRDATARAATANPPEVYIPKLFRNLPYTPHVPAPATPPTCQANFPDVLSTDQPEAQVTRVSTCPFQIKAVIPVFTNPLQIAITPSGSTALVTSYGPLDGSGGAVSFINLSTNQVTQTVTMASQVTPNGIAITPDGTTAYLGNFRPQGQSILVMNLAAQAITATISNIVVYPSGLTLTPDGTQLWVGSPIGTETDVIDTLSNTVVMRFNIQDVTDIAFNSTGTMAYLTSSLDNPGQVFAINTSTYQIVDRYTVGNTPADIQMAYGDQFLVVNNNGDNTISIIDLVQNAVKTTNVGGTPSGIAFVQ
jgi:DNA-binding beta-propeller fold protein YncE